MGLKKGTGGEQAEAAEGDAGGGRWWTGPGKSWWLGSLPRQHNSDWTGERNAKDKDGR